MQEHIVQVILIDPAVGRLVIVPPRYFRWPRGAPVQQYQIQIGLFNRAVVVAKNFSDYKRDMMAATSVTRLWARWNRSTKSPSAVVRQLPWGGRPRGTSYSRLR